MTIKKSIWESDEEWKRRGNAKLRRKAREEAVANFYDPEHEQFIQALTSDDEFRKWVIESYRIYLKDGPASSGPDDLGFRMSEKNAGDRARKVILAIDDPLFVKAMNGSFGNNEGYEAFSNIYLIARQRLQQEYDGEHLQT